MVLKFFIFSLLSINCFAADQSVRLHDDGGNPYITAIAIGLALHTEWKLQRNITTQISHQIVTNSEGKEGALFTYSPHQRLVAVDRQKAVALSTCNLINFIIRPMSQYVFRNSISAFSLVECVLLPMVVFNASKGVLNTVVPELSDVTRTYLAGVNALMVPHLFIASGVSPDRVVLNAFLNHVLAHLHNVYGEMAYMRTVTGSLLYASQVMPVTQMMVSKWYKKPSMLTVHPVNFRMGSVNRNVEFMHAVVPALVLAGVDSVFNGLATTSLGTAIERGVDSALDAAITSMPRSLRQPVKKVTKKALVETVKITTAVVITRALEVNGCIIL